MELSDECLIYETQCNNKILEFHWLQDMYAYLSIYIYIYIYIYTYLYQGSFEVCLSRLVVFFTYLWYYNYICAGVYVYIDMYK